MNTNRRCRFGRNPGASAHRSIAPASVLLGAIILLGPAEGLAESPAPTTDSATADVASVRVRGGLGAMVGIVASEHRTSMVDCDGACRSGRDVADVAFGWSAMGRLGVTTEHVGIYYFGAGPVWAYTVAGTNDGSLQVSLPHSVLLALLPSDDVEIALGPTFSWVGAWDPWAFGGTLVVSAMIEPTVSAEGYRSAPSISALMTPLVDTFGSAWVLLGLGVGYDWY